MTGSAKRRARGRSRGDESALTQPPWVSHPHVMRLLSDLINHAESAWPFVTETANKVAGRCAVHPAGVDCDDVLVETQVTTRSPMGAVVYHTGGISIEGGWLRILGSSSPAIPRSLPEWNNNRSSGFYLVADDVMGGSFAIDGGGLGYKPGEVCYFSPRSLRWEPLDANYTQFLIWACTDFRDFYSDLRWSGWQSDLATLAPDWCFFFYPPLWTKECSLPASRRGTIPIGEAYDSQMNIARQLNGL